MKKLSFIPIALLIFFVFTSCEKDNGDLIIPGDAIVDARSQDCFNFKTSFEDGCLNIVSFDIIGFDDLITGFGAAGIEGNVGEFSGMWYSAIIDETPSGSGATHYKLIHKFVDNMDGDYFYTDDRAVCSPAIGLGATCLINDQMTIVGGTGKFENVSGKIKTHGPLTLGDPVCPEDFGSLSLKLHGRVCMN